MKAAIAITASFTSSERNPEIGGIMLQTNATTKANAEKIEMPITFSSEAVDFCFFVFILFPFSKEGKKKNLGLLRGQKTVLILT